MGNQKTAPFFLMGALNKKKRRLMGAQWAQQKTPENRPSTHKNCKKMHPLEKNGVF